MVEPGFQRAFVSRIRTPRLLWPDACLQPGHELFKEGILLLAAALGHSEDKIVFKTPTALLKFVSKPYLFAT